MLKKQNRLGKITRKTSDEFFTSPLFNIRVSDNGGATTKFGFVVSKKIDKRAVVRNRLKRQLSSATEKVLKNIVKGKNVVVIPKKEHREYQEKELSESLQDIFRKAKILQ
jgi:ribonuclease P protein component